MVDANLIEDIKGYSALVAFFGGVVMMAIGFGLALWLTFWHLDISVYLPVGLILGGLMVSAIGYAVLNMMIDDHNWARDFEEETK